MPEFSVQNAKNAGFGKKITPRSELVSIHESKMNTICVQLKLTALQGGGSRKGFHVYAKKRKTVP